MVRVYLLGGLRAEAEGEPLGLPSSRKAQLLLAMLALERRAHGRSELAGRLWPDVREDSARASLRNALAQLRGALGEHAEELVTTEGTERVALAPGTWTDVGEVGRLLGTGRPEEAADLCAHELLAGFDDDWVLTQRDELAGRLAESLGEAAMAAEGAGDMAQAVRLSRRLTALDPLAEIAHRDLIRRLVASGDRAAALAAYDRFRKRLADELTVVPSAATRALVEDIRAPEAPARRAAVSTVRYARNGDRSIAYQRFGAGESDLVIVPGWASNLDEVWDFPPLGPMYSRLGAIANCLVFDKRGTGLSDRDGDFGSLEERANDIGAVMDAAGMARATLFAYSESAALALVFAAAHPERVEGLVLYSSYARLRRAPDYPAGFPDELVDAFVEEIRRSWGRGTVSLVSFHGVPPTPAAENLIARWERSLCTPTMAAHIIKRNGEIDVRALLPAVEARTLVLHSTGDPIAPAALGRYVADHIPGARYVEQEAAYHLPWRGEDAWFLDEVERFVTGRPAAAAVRRRVLASVVAAGPTGTVEFFDHPSEALAHAASIGAAGDISVGVHTGEIEQAGDEPAGVAVDIAREVAALASPGEVLVSRTVHDLTIGSSLRFTGRGTHTFPGTPGAWEVFALQLR
jgi:DNA-binding SARP family transcriptional activator/pimeloyl-ACP methyl ester carboxylesterase